MHGENLRKFTETRARAPRGCHTLIFCRLEVQYSSNVPVLNLVYPVVSLHTTAVVSYFDYCKQTASGTAVTPPHPPRRLARRQARVFGSPLRLPPRSSLLTLRRPTECGHRPKPTPAQVRRTQGAPRPTVRLGSRQLAAGFISSSVLFHRMQPPMQFSS